MNEEILLSQYCWESLSKGAEIRLKREIAQARAPQKIDMSKVKMRMSGGQYAVGKGVNAPVDPVSGVPIAGG